MGESPPLLTHLSHLTIIDDQKTAEGSEKSDAFVRSPAEGKVAGMQGALQCMRELIGWPLQYGAEGKELGIRWLRGILLHGPPGCGKNLLVNAVAQEFGASVHHILAAGIFGAYTGESEERLRAAFQEAMEEAAEGRPTIIFLDEVDALCPRRNAHQAHESRVVAQLLTLLDGAVQQDTNGRLVVVAATNRPNAIDPALRRPGRLDREIAIPVPNQQARREILELQTCKMPLAASVCLPSLAATTVGYSGADLAALCQEAAMLALGAHPSFKSQATSAGVPGPDETAGVKIEQSHFIAAMTKVGPSILRSSAVELPSVRWEDIGGLEGEKLRLKQAVEWPIRHAAAFRRLGLTPARGILLYGPSGCCKTTLVHAAATASGASFQALTGSQLLSAFLGEGEALLRTAFQTARAAAPAIIFLDELDTLAGSRGSLAGPAVGSSGGAARLLSTLLTEMDGMELAEGILVLAATNRPYAIDPALLRPGRFEVHLYIPPPDGVSRLEILKIHTKSMPLAGDVNLQVLAQDLEGYTGADLKAVCQEAALDALREDVVGTTEIYHRHFAAARCLLRPSISEKDLSLYQKWPIRSNKT